MQSSSQPPAPPRTPPFRHLLLVVFALLVALPGLGLRLALASDLAPQAAIDRLGEPYSLPERDELVAHFADPGQPLPFAALDAALAAPQWPTLLLAIRVAEVRGDPAHAPALFRVFLRSKAAALPHDPDIFERALRILQGVPADQLREAIASASSEPGAEMAIERLDHDWLGPLAQVDTRSAAASDPALQRTLEAHFDEWLTWLLDQGPEGLVSLQSDSGDQAFQLFVELQVDVLAWHVLASGAEEREAAIETCRLRSVGGDDLRALSRLADFQAFSPRWMQLRLVLDRLRIARLLGSWRPGMEVLQPDPRGAWLDEQEPTEEDRALTRRVGASVLEGNVRRIAWLARRAGVPMLFVAQAQNEDACGVGTAAGAAESDEVDCFPPEAREAVVRASGRAGVAVVDAAAALRSRHPEGRVDSRWLLDVIHLSREGNAVVGEAAAPEAIRLLRGRP